MWIVYWTTKHDPETGTQQEDHYDVKEEESNAQNLLTNIRMKDGIYTAGYAKIIESTEAHHTD